MESHSVFRKSCSLHGFPNPNKQPELFRRWLYAIGGNIIGLENNFIYKNRRVCHNHFEQKYWCRFNRLTKAAVPTLGLLGSCNLPHFSFNERSSHSSGNYEFKPTALLSEDAILFQDIIEDISIQSENKENITPNDVVVDNERPQSSNNYKCLRTYMANNAENTSICTSDATKTIEVEIPNATCNVESPHSSTYYMAKNAENTSSCTSDATKTMELDIPNATCIAPKPKITKKLKRSEAVTELEKALRKEIRNLKRKLYKRESKIMQQKRELDAAKNIFSNPNFVKTMDNWTAPAKLLTVMQFRENKKLKKGRRFTVQEKIVALTMLKQSPKSYRFLRKIFVLPSSQTLMKLLANCSLSTGLNDNIFNQLKLKADGMKTQDKLCSLIFDEMHLSTNIFYSERKDVIIGFVTDGEESMKQFADHAQVFMIKGVIRNYKQPVAYTFSASATKGPVLAKQIKLVINQLQQAGFIVVCTICDQGTNNRLAIKWLKEDYKRNCLKNNKDIKNENVFEINDQEIVPLFDPPHLIKCLRNNLLTKDLKYKMDGKVGVAKWQHIEKLYHENPGYKGLRLMPTLTEGHVVPQKINKMKVKYATQIFSRTVSSNMGYLADKGILPDECKQTADLLYFADNLYDSLNGSYSKKRYAKPLLDAVTPNSMHLNEWQKSKKIINTFEFINKISGKKENVPTIDGWLKTIDGVIYLTQFLKTKYEVSSIWMRHFNQDCIENFFGAIRSHGFRNVNPSPAQFESAFTTLLINNMSSVHAPGANCENDNAQLLQALLPDRDCKVTNEITIDFNDLMEIEILPLSEKNDPRKMAPLKYVAGYFIKRAKTLIYKNCPECKACLEVSSDEYINYREYSKKHWLCSPSESLLKTFSELQDITSHLIPQHINKPDLRGYIALVATVLINMNYINCDEHKMALKKFFYNDIIRFFIFNYCKTINKILKGKRRDEISDDMQRLARNYFDKYKNYNKNK